MKSHLLIYISSLCFSFSTMANVCQENALQKTAWGLSNSQARTFLSDATLPGNLSASDGEVRDRLVNSISSFYRARGASSSYVSADSLAAKIQWAAQCTGNDFSMLAGIIKVESAYCSLLHNKGGGDSGCGQFTSAAIGFYRNQLRLPGRKENGSTNMKNTIETIMRNCASGSTYVQEDSLHKLFSESKASIREKLRGGHNISLDVLATAIYLKFYYSISGFYYKATDSRPGALSRYNGGGFAGYGKKMNGVAHQINGEVCEKDESYLEEIQEATCDLSMDKEVCDLLTPTYSI
jgi:hypothetical protein